MNKGCSVNEKLRQIKFTRAFVLRKSRLVNSLGLFTGCRRENLNPGVAFSVNS
jgi:hypothetical protein